MDVILFKTDQQTFSHHCDPGLILRILKIQAMSVYETKAIEMQDGNLETTSRYRPVRKVSHHAEKICCT